MRGIALSSALGLIVLMAVVARAQTETGAIRVRVQVPDSLQLIPGVQLSLTQQSGEGPLDLPDNEEDLLKYLKELAAARGILAEDLQIRTTGRPNTLSSSSPPCPSANAPVRISSPQTVTNAEGTAEFQNLKPGQYTLKAGREGYIGLTNGSATVIAPSLATSTVTVDRGQQGQAVLFLNPEATLRGRVLDARGAPVANACVELGVLQRLNGETVFVRGPAARTDAIGDYRVYSVSPGEYVVRVRTAAGSSPSNDFIFFPNSPTLQDATLVPVQAGSETVGIDIKVPTQVQLDRR